MWGMNESMFYLWTFAGFVFLLGCCVGSFLNVVIWRLPFLGHTTEFKGQTGPLSLSWPPSHCPECHKAVRWRENIPVLSWLMLRGRCSGCQKPISPRYPLVELGTGVVFLALYVAYFPAGVSGPGFHGLWHGGPTLALDFVYVAVLLAASGIDADWFIIPLRLPWLIIIAAIISSLAGAQPMLPSLAGDSAWARIAVGGSFGLVISWVLLSRGIFPRSFSAQNMQAGTDPPQKAIDNSSSECGVPGGGVHPPPQIGSGKLQPILLTGLVIVLLQIPAWLLLGRPAAVLSLLVSGIILFLLGVLPRPESPTDSSDLAEEVLDEAADPNARGEILKELLFVLPVLALAGLAALFPIPMPQAAWMERIYGLLLGLLAGGGIVWFFRIFGTLLLGRVAMGLGDVHLMAAIGAVVGAPLAIIAFFIAPFVALVWVVVLKIMGRPNVLPFGPWLSTAGIVVLLIGPPVQGWYARQLFPPQHTRANPHQIIWPGENPAP